MLGLFVMRSRWMKRVCMACSCEWQASMKVLLFVDEKILHKAQGALGISRLVDQVRI